jgi:hypothetical protein
MIRESLMSFKFLTTYEQGRQVTRYSERSEGTIIELGRFPGYTRQVEGCETPLMCTLHLGESELCRLGGTWNELVGIQTIDVFCPVSLTFRVIGIGGRGGVGGQCSLNFC